MGTVLVILLLAGLAGWLWAHWMHVRERATEVSRKACRASEVQFLDDTVSLSAVRLAWRRYGGLCLRRTYEFEYSTTGNDRHTGCVVLAGTRVESVRLPGVDPGGDVVI